MILNMVQLNNKQNFSNEIKMHFEAFAIMIKIKVNIICCTG